MSRGFVRYSRPTASPVISKGGRFTPFSPSIGPRRSANLEPACSLGSRTKRNERSSAPSWKRPEGRRLLPRPHSTRFGAVRGRREGASGGRGGLRNPCPVWAADRGGEPEVLHDRVATSGGGASGDRHAQVARRPGSAAGRRGVKVGLSNPGVPRTHGLLAGIWRTGLGGTSQAQGVSCPYDATARRDLQAMILSYAPRRTPPGPERPQGKPPDGAHLILRAATAETIRPSNSPSRSRHTASGATRRRSSPDLRRKSGLVGLPRAACSTVNVS